MTLPAAPPSLLDGAGQPILGRFAGTVRDFDPAAPIGRLGAIARKKGWLYLGVATERRYLGLAIVRLGYAASAFAYVLDHAHRTLVFDDSRVGLPTQAVLRATTGPGAEARFRGAHCALAVTRDTERPVFRVAGNFGALELDLALDGAEAPPPLLAVHRTPGAREGAPALFSATEKRLALTASGAVTLAGRRYELRDAVAGYDFSFGYPPRHTVWNWAMILGRHGGRPFGVNLVRGFIGAAECAAFYDGAIHPLAEGEFAYTAETPELPWGIRSAGEAASLEARFLVDGVHREEKNLGLLTSRFLQPVGAFSGALTLPGATIPLDGALGVVEEQDVRW